MKCYYAHPMSLYGTPQEARDIKTLEKLGFEVVNPSQFVNPGMRFCLAAVEKCGVLAFRATPDGSVTSGVGAEIENAAKCGLPVIELPSALARRTLTVEQTYEYLQETGQR